MEKTALKETENPEILDTALDIILFAKTKAEVMETFDTSILPLD